MTDRLTVMTFNVRYDEEADGLHAWPHRRSLVRATIEAHAPDLLGVQEPMPHQWDDLTRALPLLSPFPSADEAYHEEPVGGFFRLSRLEARDSGTFWLSDTPDAPHSITWPNDYGARLCRWVKLHDRQAQREIVFACTHFDTNALSSVPSAKVVHAELDAAVGSSVPIVLVGDFNCAAGSGAHEYLRREGGYRDAWTEAGHADDGVVTFNGFADGAGPQVDGEHGNYRIDWILVRGPLRCTSAEIDSRREGGMPPSDHYPVIATLEWQ